VFRLVVARVSKRGGNGGLIRGIILGRTRRWGGVVVSARGWSGTLGVEERRAG